MSLLQAVSDNNDAMNSLMVQLVERVKVISEACKDAESDDAKEKIDGFIRYGLSCRQSTADATFNSRILVRNTSQIQKLCTKPTWKKVLANEETTKEIQDFVQEMDQSLDSFQVCTSSLKFV